MLASQYALKNRRVSWGKAKMPFIDVVIIVLVGAWLAVIFVGAVSEHVRLRRDERRGIDRSEIRSWVGDKRARS
jgi:hypothetical protein